MQLMTVALHLCVGPWARMLVFVAATLLLGMYLAIRGGGWAASESDLGVTILSSLRWACPPDQHLIPLSKAWGLGDTRLPSFWVWGRWGGGWANT